MSGLEKSMKEQSSSKNYTYQSKGKISDIAEEVLDLLGPMGLPVWQVKEVLKKAMELTDWQTFRR